jgi:hypothetical protein
MKTTVLLGGRAATPENQNNSRSIHNGVRLSYLIVFPEIRSRKLRGGGDEKAHR